MEVCIHGEWKPFLDITSDTVSFTEDGFKIQRPLGKGCRLRFKNHKGEWVYLRVDKGAILE